MEKDRLVIIKILAEFTTGEVTNKSNSDEYMKKRATNMLVRHLKETDIGIPGKSGLFNVDIKRVKNKRLK